MTLGFTTHGDGPQGVLVLHDWLGDHTNYDPILPWLDGAAFTYAFADLRGYGLSRDIAGDYCVAEIARDCLDLADALGWRRFHVLGHSMTGMVTQRLAAEAPERIAGAIAVCPVSAAGNRLDAATKAFFASTATDDAAFLRLMRFVTGLSERYARVRLARNRAHVAPGCRLAYLDMLTQADFAHEVRGLATPFLVVTGDRDPGLDEAAMRQTFLAWYPHAESRVIGNSGHYPMQECPPAFAMVIEDFLRRHAAID